MVKDDENKPRRPWRKRSRSASEQTELTRAASQLGSTGDTKPHIVWRKRSPESILESRAHRIKLEVLQDLETNPTKAMIEASTPGTRVDRFSYTDAAGGRHITPLSNFFPISVGEFSNVESGFQRGKFRDEDLARAEKDKGARDRVGAIVAKAGFSCTTFAEIFTRPYVSPGVAKAVAWAIKDFQRPDWFDINLELMEKLLLQKFTQRDMARYLLGTGSKTIFEGNTWGDRHYGVAMDTNGNLEDGKNLLGRSLMIIRRDLASGRLPIQ